MIVSSGRAEGLSEPSVSLRNVTKAFGDFVAVRELDLDIAEGEFFTLLGPSGCGKTTTLRMIAGFEQPTSGQILLDGEDMAFTPPHKRNVNTVLTSRANGGRPLTSSPPRVIVPLVGCSKPAISRSTVVLPEPDGPSMEKNSPSAISRSRSSTARTSLKCLLSPRSSIAVDMTER